MVRAILAGRKMVTRREVKGEALRWLKDFHPEYVALPDNNLCRYGYAGDLLYVRETTSFFRQHGGSFQREKTNYKADERWDGNKSIKWTPSIHVPKALARLWLQNMRVRIERLHDITEEEAMKEGIQAFPLKTADGTMTLFGLHENQKEYSTRAVSEFETLWRDINGDESWESNPWVWRIEFKEISRTGRHDKYLGA